MPVFDERRAENTGARIGLLGRQARGLHSLLLLVGFVLGALLIVANDHTLAQHAVQESEFRDTSQALRRDMRFADSIAGARSAENRASIDTALSRIAAMFEANQRQQIRALCKAVRSDATVCTDGNGR